MMLLLLDLEGGKKRLLSKQYILTHTSHGATVDDKSHIIGKKVHILHEQSDEGINSASDFSGPVRH